MLFCNRSKDFQKETKLTTIPWSKHNITVGSKDLHVFVPDDSPNMFDTISRLKDVFCPRSAINSEYWLFDESIWALPFEIDELPLRLDDNFYIFKGNENSITIWEYYEIHKTVPRKFQFYGTWSLFGGLSVTKIDKWTRRQNLQVFTYIFTFIYENSFKRVINFYFHMKYVHYTGTKLSEFLSGSQVFDSNNACMLQT